jgi:septin 3/9/12
MKIGKDHHHHHYYYDKRIYNNHHRSWEPIIKYIKDQHSAYLRKELTATRDRYIQDTRVHCCLFFIGPTVHA